MLEEIFGIFEEDGEIFIESDIIEYIMESYDLSEEDGIDVIMESYEEELYSEAEEDWKEKVGKYVGDPRNLKNSGKNLKDNAIAYKNAIEVGNSMRAGGFEGETGMEAHHRKEFTNAGKQFAKDAAIPAAAIGGALVLRKMAKARKRRKLREDYGIFEENGELFIENEMVEFVMESYELSEEDAIDVIMESYEEELMEDEDLLDEEELLDEGIADNVSGRQAALGATALIGGTLAARKLYGQSKANVRNKEKKLRKANEKLQFHKDTRDYMDRIEASRKRGEVEKGEDAGTQNYKTAHSIAKVNKLANRKIYRAQRNSDRAQRDLDKARAKYDRAQARKQERREKIKKGYSDFRQSRRDRKNPPQPQPEPRRRFGYRRPQPEPVPVKKSRFRQR